MLSEPVGGDLSLVGGDSSLSADERVCEEEGVIPPLFSVSLRSSCHRLTTALTVNRGDSCPAVHRWALASTHCRAAELHTVTGLHLCTQHLRRTRQDHEPETRIEQLFIPSLFCGLHRNGFTVHCIIRQPTCGHNMRRIVKDSFDR